MPSDVMGKLSDWFTGDMGPKGETAEERKKRRKKRAEARRNRPGNVNARKVAEESMRYTGGQ